MEYVALCQAFSLLPEADWCYYMHIIMLAFRMWLAEVRPVTAAFDSQRGKVR